MGEPLGRHTHQFAPSLTYTHAHDGTFVHAPDGFQHYPSADMPEDVYIGPIEHVNSQCQKTGCECWCQACERHNWRHARYPENNAERDELARQQAQEIARLRQALIEHRCTNPFGPNLKDQAVPHG